MEHISQHTWRRLCKRTNSDFKADQSIFYEIWTPK